MFFRRSPAPAAAAPLSDQELLARYRAHGDVADLGTLYDRYLTEAFAVCRRYLAPPDEDAQDAVMQLFEHLVVKLRTHEPDNFGAWLHVTARNHCLMQLRAQKRAGGKILHFPDAAGMESATMQHQAAEAGAAAEAEETEMRLQTIEQALGQLPAAQRQCLELFYLEKLSYREVAERTGLELNLVKSHLQNGKRMLRRQLDPPPPPRPAPDRTTPHNGTDSSAPNTSPLHVRR